MVFADSSLRPTGIFGDTVFPDDDEPSQFDLDVHAIVEVGDGLLVGVVNHYGLVRLFERPGPPGPGSPIGPDLVEQARLDFVADVERIVAVGDRLVTSRPRGERLGGLLVTAPLTTGRHRLDADTVQESFGVVTALTADGSSEGDGWIALGGEGRVRLVETRRGCPAAGRWETSVDFLVTALVACGSSLWAAGSASGGTDLDDYDWEQLRGGGLARLDLDSGDVAASARFGGDLAWGSGGAPLVVTDGVPCGIGRRGELHVLTAGAEVTTLVTDGVSPDPLGIAHAAVVGGQVVFGFNRGGYRLHSVPSETVVRLARNSRFRRA